jgi:hypothetical protein
MKSNRSRDAKTLQSGVAIILLMMLGVSIWALIFVPIPSSNKDTLNLVIGGQLNALGMMTAYFFGTSQTSDLRASTAAVKADQQAGIQP